MTLPSWKKNPTFNIHSSVGSMTILRANEILAKFRPQKSRLLYFYCIDLFTFFFSWEVIDPGSIYDIVIV